MRRAIYLAASLAASIVCADSSTAQVVSHDYYFSTTVGQFLQSCQNNDVWCLSVIAPRIEAEAYRFCVPADHAAAASAVLQWLRAHQNDSWVGTSGYSQPAANEYLAKAVRTAMDSIWGEMGKACPFPQGSGDDDLPF